MSTNRKLFIIFSLILLTELLSLLGHYLPMVNFIAFFIIVLLTAILAYYKLEYGLWILITELFIGSFGYIFYFEYSGIKISLRLALWLIIMSVWLAKSLTNWLKTTRLDLAFLKSAYFNYFLILFIFVFWGLVNGLIKGNAPNNIFFDFNSWLYFLLLLPLWPILIKEENSPTLKQIFLTASFWLSLKTLIIFYLFSHNFAYFNLAVYEWVRNSGVGEITQVQGGFYRVFLQSQIFILLGIFFVWLNLLKEKNNHVLCIILNALYFSAILISFSRSFWLGLAIGFIVVWLIIIFKFKLKLKAFFYYNFKIFLAAIFSLAITAAVLFLPWPKSLGGFNPGNLLSERTTNLSEAGASSRWQLLNPLWRKITEAPIMGQGFGATVTYLTRDPRVLASSPKGEYTTYAFEWGWLDVWLKLGFFGLLAYLILFAKIIFIGLKNNSAFSLALACGLIVLAGVNLFSPYVNHPLGIGYLIIAAALLPLRE